MSMEPSVAPFYHPGAGLPRFHRALRERTRDLTLLLWGDSLLAREQHTSAGDLDPAALPPTMHTRKLDWHVWQGLHYPQPTYRRLDYPGFFRTDGDWCVAEGDPAWDDTGYRPGWTAFSADGDAACHWTLPAGRDWSAAALIYRTDATGTQAELHAEGGSGSVQAWDEARRAWVEADGYRLWQRQETGVPRTGNTTYQRRLHLRRIAPPNRAVAMRLHRVGGGEGERLLLWGLEAWDPSRPVLRLINSARGSHTLEMLVHSLENEVRSHRPDLIVLELPLLNMLHQRPDPEDGVRWVWDVVWGDRPGAENDWALTRGRDGEVAPEVLLLLPHHTHVHLSPEDGWVGYGKIAPPKYFAAVRELLRRRGDVPWLDMAAAFLAAIDADPRFGSRYEALAGSAPGGPTYTNDGLHQNDRGTAVYARHLCPVLRGE